MLCWLQNDLQAMARCHRIGQSKDVTIYRLVCRDTYEAQIFQASSRKYGEPLPSIKHEYRASFCSCRVHTATTLVLSCASQMQMSHRHMQPGKALRP